MAASLCRRLSKSQRLVSAPWRRAAKCETGEATCLGARTMSHVLHPADAPPEPLIGFDDWLKADVRVGTIVEALPFPEARKPSYKLVIDFGGTIGRRKSSAQITRHYGLADLPGRQVMAVVNFPPRQIGKYMSEVLTLGVPDADGEVVLLHPSQAVPNGGRLF